MKTKKICEAVFQGYVAPTAKVLGLSVDQSILQVSAGFGEAGENGNDFGEIINPDW